MLLPTANYKAIQNMIQTGLQTSIKDLVEPHGQLLGFEHLTMHTEP